MSCTAIRPLSPGLPTASGLSRMSATRPPRAVSNPRSGWSRMAVSGAPTLRGRCSSTLPTPERFDATMTLTIVLRLYDDATNVWSDRELPIADCVGSDQVIDIALKHAEMDDLTLTHIRATSPFVKIGRAHLNSSHSQT